MTATPARGNGWPSESILSPLNPVYPGSRVAHVTTSQREVLPRQDTRLLNNLLIMCGFLPARAGTHATTIVYIARSTGQAESRSGVMLRNPSPRRSSSTDVWFSACQGRHSCHYNRMYREIDWTGRISKWGDAAEPFAPTLVQYLISDRNKRSVHVGVRPQMRAGSNSPAGSPCLLKCSGAKRPYWPRRHLTTGKTPP